MIYDAYNAILNDVIKKKIIIAGFMLVFTRNDLYFTMIQWRIYIVW